MLRTVGVGLQSAAHDKVSSSYIRHCISSGPTPQALMPRYAECAKCTMALYFLGCDFRFLSSALAGWVRDARGPLRPAVHPLADARHPPRAHHPRDALQALWVLSGIDDETASPHAPVVSIRGGPFSQSESAPIDGTGHGWDAEL